MAAKKKTSTRRSTRRVRPTARKKATRRLQRMSKNARGTARKTKASKTGRKVRSVAGKKATGFERTWTRAQARLSGAEVRVEKEIRALAKRMGIDTRQASKHVKEWNRLLDREVRKASRRIDAGLDEFEKAVKKEQRSVSRIVDDAVGRALAALNIPTRREVQALTRKVHQLSRKIDRYGR
jgi:hypothetical protein